MSISQNPLTGHMRKSMGNFTVLKSRGKNIIRSKPFQPKDPKTERQLLQRLKFKLLTDVYLSFGSIPDKGFVENRKQLTTYNLFLSVNYRLVYDKNSKNPVIDYRKLLVSKGSMPRLKVLECILTNEGILVSFETGLELPKASVTDELTAFAKLKNGELLIATQPRGVVETGTIVLEYRDLNVEEIVCCYFFARSIDGKCSSNSMYIELRLLSD